jgi:hypothetical protein
MVQNFKFNLGKQKVFQFFDLKNNKICGKETPEES